MCEGVLKYVIFVTAVEAAGVCYHDSLLPDGEVKGTHCQNNVFEEGRPLHCIHHPVMDPVTVKGLAT